MLRNTTYSAIAGVVGASLALLLTTSDVWVPDMPGAAVVLAGAFAAAITFGLRAGARH